MIEYIKKLLRETLRSWEAGLIAFNLQRISGLLVLLYLFLHLFVLSAIREGGEAYTARIESITSPVFKFFEWLLLFVVAFHTLNGIRILMVDFLGMTRLQKPVFWVVALITAVIMVASIPVFFTFLH